MVEQKRYDTWTYASANSVTTPGDMTGTYWKGMRVALKQTTIKYFMIESVVYSSPNTTITLNGFGTYTLTNDPITAHIDTLETHPKGFPAEVASAHGHVAADVTSPTPSGKYLKDDGTWATPAGSGDVTGPASAVDSNFASYNGVTGKVIKDSGSKASDFAAASHNQAASTITSGTLDGDRLPAMSTTKKGGVPSTGTPAGKYLKDDGTWATPAGAGDVVGPSGATDGNLPLFDGATGKLLKNSTYAPSSFAAATHNQAASTINSGTLDAARIPDLSGTYVPKSLLSEQGDIAYRDGSGWQVLHHGATIRQFLKTGAHGANPSWSSLGLPFVTVGASDCDYITDGTDDAVQIQEAIDYCAGAAARPKIVLLLNQEYNLGNYGLTLKTGVELVGHIVPRVDCDDLVGYVVGSCTSINVTSTTYNAVTMKTHTAIRRIRFDYPNQSADSVITYPATITDSPATTNGPIQSVIVEDVTGCMPYSFIDFGTAVTTTRVDYTIQRVRGDPLVHGIRFSCNGQGVQCFDVQFVPGFGGRMAPNHGTLLNYMHDNLNAFYMYGNLGGVLQNCESWISKSGYDLDMNISAIIDCMAESSQYPLRLKGDYNYVVGGDYIAGKLTWTGGVNYVSSWPDGWNCIEVTGDMNMIIGARILAANNGVYIASTAERTAITGCAIEGACLSQTGTYKAGIWDDGTLSSITGNTIGTFGVDLSATPSTGIMNNGIDSVFSGNTIVRNKWYDSWGDVVLGASEVRSVFDGLGRNDGNPNTTGNWNGYRRSGVIVHDYTNDKRYIDVSSSGESPAWKEI